jgi:hypothetical protein
VRTFDWHTVVLEETFQGFRNLDDLEEQVNWAVTDSAGIAVVGIGEEGYDTSGQRRHLAFTLNNTTGGAATVSVNTKGRGTGIWPAQTGVTSHTVSVSVWYKLDAALAGATVSVTVSNSFFGTTLSALATADGEWHELTDASWQVFEDSSLAGGITFEVSGIPAGAEGVARFDDLKITRSDAPARGIDADAPVCALRWNGEGGYRESVEYRTGVHVARDGTETRTPLRAFPRYSLAYETRATEPQDAGLIDRWVHSNHGRRVLVPRWPDACTLVSVTVSNTVINVSEDMTTRYFEPYGMIMLWDSPLSYEALQTWQILSTTAIRLDPLNNVVTGTWTPGTTKVVPLVPARWSPEQTIQRPNGGMGIVPLAFDVDVVQ